MTKNKTEPMNWWDRQQEANEALKAFADIEFTKKELDAASRLMTPIPTLVLKGPDDKFRKALQKCVEGTKALLAKRLDKRNAKSVNLKGPIYGVPWIEVEFGQRSEGWALFMDLKTCVRETQKASKRGAYEGGGGYLGPERPLHCYEIPTEGLETEYAKSLKETGFAHTDNHWHPKYTGERHSIEEK